MPRRDDPQPGFGRAVRDLRKKQNLTQEALGKKADIHPTWICHIESGRINLTWGNARRIAEALKVSLGELADLAQENERDPLTAERLARIAPPAPPPSPISPQLLLELEDVFHRFMAVRLQITAQAAHEQI